MTYGCAIIQDEKLTWDKQPKSLLEITGGSRLTGWNEHIEDETEQERDDSATYNGYYQHGGAPDLIRQTGL